MFLLKENWSIFQDLLKKDVFHYSKKLPRVCILRIEANEKKEFDTTLINDHCY